MKRIALAFAAFPLFFLLSCSSKDKGGDVVVSYEEHVANVAAAYYLGWSEESGCDVYGLSFFEGEVNEDYRLDSKGLELYFELLCPVKNTLGLQPGTYNARLTYPATSSDYTFTTGSVIGSTVYGSYLEEVPSEVSDPKYYMVSDGIVTVGKRGSTYVMEAKVTAGGIPMSFTYSGAVDFLDMSTQEGDIEADQDINFSAFTKGELDYYGPADGVTVWGIYLADDDIDMETLGGNGNLLSLELCTTSTAKDGVPVGTYTVGSTPGDFVANALYESGDSYAGSMFCRDDLIQVGATSGSVRVSKEGDNYSIVVFLYDEEFNNKFNGTYNGPLTYVDYSSSPVSAPSPARVKARRGSRASWGRR